MILKHTIFEPFKQINLKERCKYCDKSLEQILNEYRKKIGLYSSFTYEEALNYVPCLTQDEWIIKSIIE
jgi:hypothetical protein